MNRFIHLYNYGTLEDMGTLDEFRQHELNEAPVYYYFEEIADSDSSKAVFMIEGEITEFPQFRITEFGWLDLADYGPTRLGPTPPGVCVVCGIGPSVAPVGRLSDLARALAWWLHRRAHCWRPKPVRPGGVRRMHQD